MIISPIIEVDELLKIYKNSDIMISDDKIEYAALPWSWCECTRDSQWIDGNGQTHTSTMGTCENRGDCSRCGRSDIRGNCRGGSCPGC